METHDSTLRSTTSRRIILFPLPFQGHINPMLQLANILHTRGFKITIIHAEYNSPNPSNYPQFTFKPIKDRFSAIADQLPTNPDTTYYLKYLNESCVDPFRDCLAGLLAEERVACVITDAGFYFAQAVADDLKICRIVLRTSSLGGLLACKVLPFFSKKASFYLTKEANMLHTRGFNITVIHAEYNSPNPSNYPHFTFIPIKDRFSEIADQLPTNPDASYFLNYLNKSCEQPFRDCLAGLLAEPGEERFACVITDAAFYFTQAVADDLKLPRIVLRTSCIGCVITYDALPFYSKKACFKLTKQDPDYEASVPEYPLLKFKDIAKITINPQGTGDFATNMLSQMRASSGIIWNTFKELEESDLETLSRDFPVPSFTLGPFHKYFPASSSSLIEQDRTILSWLDKQPPKSVVYVSFGSVAHITESEFQEVAHGLVNTGLPFLWVVRPGIVIGSEWLEALPEKFLERMGERGRIVKWSPQQEVLAHPATGCFWTHNGWNSTLESICEGVPMICSPCFVDQPINARYVSDVWKIGVMLEDGFERVGIEMAIKRVMMDKEGEEMCERVTSLKEKVNLSLAEGGSSCRSLNNLVDYISSL
uniref:Putative UDP-glucuronosyl/UDP-glucosyltransferase n=1 Tax=Helianthus annuus TaxID=4232 RepID=A0A251SQ17_HELAN